MQVLNMENFEWKSLLSLKGLSAVAAALLFVAGGTTLAVSYSIASSGKIVSGVTFEGKPISGMKADKAQTFFANQAKTKMHPLTFKYGDSEFQITPEDINLTPLTEKAADEACSYGRGNGLLKNLGEQIKCSMKGREVKLAASYDEELLNKKIDAIAAQIDREPVNAICNIQSDGSITYIPGIIGKKLDGEKIAESLKEPLTNLNLPSGVVELVPEDINPFITTEDVANIDAVIGQYSTQYKPGARGDNIWIAANALCDKIVRPGWTFSFNEAVGARTYDAGYQNANVIINGKVAVDVGGGVCQVSSTLYNAVLLAGLTPVERTSHYFKSTYIAGGRDATVADGLIDFKFRNDLPHNVYLLASASGSTLTVFILGTKSDLNGSTIAIESEGSDMSPSIYRVYYKDGKVIKDEFLHTDVYHVPKD